MADGTVNLHIIRNHIGTPVKLDGSKQPIAFQIATGGNHLRPLVFNNYITGTDEPHIRGTATLGTADNISMHRAVNAMVTHNCVSKAGELGINYSLGTIDSNIECNYVLASDLTAINVQSSRTYPEPVYKSKGITISHNIVEAAGANAEKKRPEVIGGIYLDQMTDVTLYNNIIVGSGDVGAALYIRDSNTVNASNNSVPDHPSSRDIIRLENTRDINIDGQIISTTVNRRAINPIEVSNSVSTFDANSTQTNYQITKNYCSNTALLYR